MDPIKIIKPPLVRQSTNYTCGVAVLQSVLGYYGHFYREDKLCKILECQTDDGTKYWEIVKFVNSIGLSAEPKVGLTVDDLISEIDAGVMILVVIQAWRDDTRKSVPWLKIRDSGHYIIAIGYDEKNLYFMDPSTLGNYTYIPKQEFLDRWHDFDQNNEKVIHLGVIIKNPNLHKINDPNEFKYIQ